MPLSYENFINNSFTIDYMKKCICIFSFINEHLLMPLPPKSIYTLHYLLIILYNYSVFCLEIKHIGTIIVKLTFNNTQT